MNRRCATRRTSQQPPWRPLPSHLARVAFARLEGRGPAVRQLQGTGCALVPSRNWLHGASLPRCSSRVCGGCGRSTRQPPSAPAPFVGVLSRTSGAQWGGSSAPATVPARLNAGQRLQLDAGTAEVTLHSGCTIVVKGPADVTVDSSMRVVTQRGTVRARVGKDARGFVIETPTTNVVDLGTEVGVQVDGLSQDTDVVVFEGSVNLVVDPQGDPRDAPSNGDATPRRTRLATGEALRIDRQGGTHRITSIRSEQFPETSDSPATARRRPLIRNITDNIRDPGATSYYQIVRNGLQEESRAYVDRFHEWNGVDEDGIPPFLIGADYVMCFNSDKWEKQIEITVEVAASVELFIFFDDRLPPPQWLSDQFTQTKYRIGMDEGFRKGPAPQVTDIGGGKSIDNVYSVWRRDITRPRQIRLGPLPKHITEVSMYGIAAIPLKGTESPAGEQDEVR